MIEDKDAKFNTTPNGIMNFADFMHRAGLIKTVPAKWSDMLVPQLADRKGS